MRVAYGERRGVEGSAPAGVGVEIGLGVSPVTGRLDKFFRLKDLMPSTRYARSADRTESGTVVPPWAATIAHPVAEITSDASTAELLDALDAGLDRSGFHVRRTTHGFRATRVPWLDVVTLQAWGRTIVSAETRRSPSPVTVVVSIVLGSEHSPAKHRCVDGLNRAIEELRSRGSRVSVTDWHPANER